MYTLQLVTNIYRTLHYLNIAVTVNYYYFKLFKYRTFSKPHFLRKKYFGSNSDHKSLKIQFYCLQRFGALLHFQVLHYLKMEYCSETL